MNKLSLLRAGGTPRAFGLALGRFGKPALPALMATTAWKTVTNKAESAFVRTLAENTRSTFPAIWDELGGLAEGLGLPLDQVFAWNCRGDLWAAGEVDGCTTVQMPGEVAVLAHNEDGLDAFSPYCGLVEARPAGAQAFASFIYPGSIPGHTFAVNGAGLVITVNHIQPTGVTPGLPRMVLCRALLECERIPQAIALLERLPRAGGFHLTLAQTGEAEMQSVEFFAETVSVQAISAPATHANHMIHPGLSRRAQRTTDSSAARQVRSHALLGAEPMEILRDDGGDGLPVLCLPDGNPNTQVTLAQACFTITDSVTADVFLPGRTAPAYHIAADPADGSVAIAAT